MSETQEQPKVEVLDGMQMDLETISTMEIAEGAQKVVTLADIELHSQIAIAKAMALEKLIAHLFSASIRLTQSEDWVLFKDQDDNIHGLLDSRGTKGPGDLFGVNISKRRDDEGNDISGPSIIKEEDGSWTAYVVFDVEAVRTGRRWEGIRVQRNTKEKFRGRSSTSSYNPANPATEIGDLKSSCNTLANSKAVRIATGMSRIPSRVLEKNGVDLERCRKGSGFGSSTERTASKVADEGIKEKAEVFWKELLSHVGGDRDAAKKLFKSATASRDKKGELDGKFAGFTQFERITKSWQIKNAQANLKAHPELIDEAIQGSVLGSE